MNVLFLTPPVKDYANFGNNVIPYTEYAMYAAFLEQYAPGTRVEILECPAHRIPESQVAAEINRRQPDIVVTGVPYTPQAEDAMAGFRMVKAVSPEIVTVAEGVHFGAIPVESLQQCPELDFVIAGEAEHTLLELVQAIGSCQRDYSQIKGLAWRDGAQLIVNSRRPLINNLDDLPRPAYHLMDLDKNLYRQFYTLDTYLRIYASRGCKAHCEFCCRWGQYPGAYRTRSGRSMAAELLHVHQTYGTRIFEFYDADFGADPLMVENFCQALEEQPADIEMWVVSRADSVLAWHQRGLLPRLRRVGLNMVLIGVEYYTDEQLKAMGKSITTAEVKTASQLLRQAGIAVLGTSIIGWPHETEESANALYQYITEEVRPDILSIQCLQPFPGTPLWRRVKDEPFLEQRYSHYDKFRPLMPGGNLSREQLGRLMVGFLRRFYTDPARTGPVLASGNRIAIAVLQYAIDRFVQPGAPVVASPRIAQEELEEVAG